METVTLQIDAKTAEQLRRQTGRRTTGAAVKAAVKATAKDNGARPQTYLGRSIGKAPRRKSGRVFRSAHEFVEWAKKQ